MARLLYSRKKSVEHLREVDSELALAIDACGSFDLKVGVFSSPFESLLRSIVFQSVSTKAATTIHARVVDTIRGPRQAALSPERVLRCDQDKLRAAGLSWAKVEAMRDLARKTRAGIVPEREGLAGLSDREIIDRLVQVRGIGQWTVEMLLIFSLGRPDVLPATDLGVRKGFARVFGLEELPAPKALLAYGERWAPYRSVASWYLWRSTELPADVVLSSRLT